MVYFFLILIISLGYLSRIDNPTIRNIIQLIITLLIGLFGTSIYDYLDQLLKQNPLIFLAVTIIVGLYAAK